jgi:hypothetical protein
MPRTKETTMRAKSPFLAILILLAAGLAAGQDQPAPAAPKAPEPVFVRLSVYPTASLSRYDFNNDLDLYELRVYAELRLGSQEGPVIADALVSTSGEAVDFVKDHYEKRITVDKDRLPGDFRIEIGIKGRAPIRETFPLPDWLVLTEPKPAIADPANDLEVRWRYARFLAPVDVRAYDFRTGKEFFSENHLAGPATVVPASRLPGSTIVRVYIIQSWLYKRFLGGPDYARGSEVNVIPWSQVFVRTK